MKSGLRGGAQIELQSGNFNIGLQNVGANAAWLERSAQARMLLQGYMDRSSIVGAVLQIVFHAPDVKHDALAQIDMDGTEVGEQVCGKRDHGICLDTHLPGQ